MRLHYSQAAGINRIARAHPKPAARPAAQHPTPPPKTKGPVGIGHVRYPTAGSASAQEAQPFFVNSPLGIYLIHNGNLTNTDALRAQLNSSSSFFNRHLKTSSDSEVLLNIFADEIHRAHQKFVSTPGAGDPNAHKTEFVLEAGEAMMSALQV
jgi:amidophosphoribosyltransferase